MTSADFGGADLQDTFSHHARQYRVYATGWIIHDRLTPETHYFAAMTVIRWVGRGLAARNWWGWRNGPADGMNEGMTRGADDGGFGHRQAGQAKRPTAPSG